MKRILLLVNLVALALPAFAHEGHDKAFGNTDSVVATNQRVYISPEGQTAIGLKSEPVRIEQMLMTLEMTGSVEPADNKIHYVMSPVNGVISSIQVQQGASVQKGQLLAAIHSSEVAAVVAGILDQRATIQAEITRLRVQIQNDVQVQTKDVEHFTAEVDREKKLLAEGISARKMYLDALHELEIAQSRLEGSKRQLSQNIAALKNRLKTATDTTARRLRFMGLPAEQIETVLAGRATTPEVPILSPATGTVFARKVSLGESIDTSSKLFSIVNLSPIWASLDVHQDQVGKIRLGQSVRIRAPVGGDIMGKISSIASVVDPSERTVHARVICDNAAGVLRPNMFVTANVITGSTSDSSITVPSKALIEDGDRSWVYVKYGDEFQPVVVGRGIRAGDRTQIVDGLYEGDQVVVIGARQIRAQSMLTSKDKHTENESSATANQQTLKDPLLIFLFLAGLVLGLVISPISNRLGWKRSSSATPEKVGARE